MINELEKIFLDKRGYVIADLKDETVCVMYSGGMDSTILIARLLEEYGCRIIPVFIKRGARAELFEEMSYDYFVEYFKNKYPKRILESKKITCNIPPRDLKKNYPPAILGTLGYPLRDSQIIQMGVLYCKYLEYNKDIKVRIILAASIANDPFYHSHKEAFRLLNLLVCYDTQDWTWQLYSPFIEGTFGTVRNEDLIKWAVSTGLPLEKTRTCINSLEKACRICPECKWRNDAFKEAGIIDPIVQEV